jgi:hypothetical protein
VQADVDDLFGMHFVGTGGHYQPGGLKASERERLPRDAAAIVQQLLVWLPGDTRLYWLLGEVMNATGDVSGAADVLDECLWTRRYDAPTLRAHRQTLRAALPKPVPLSLPDEPPVVEVPAGWRADRTLITVVGAGAAACISILLYLQVRESRRKRMRRT